MDVDEAIRNLVEGEAFLEADLEERKDLAAQLLDDLAQDGLIDEVYFDESGQQYSFLYEDGSLGGISLASLDPAMNDTAEP